MMNKSYKFGFFHLFTFASSNSVLYEIRGKINFTNYRPFASYFSTLNEEYVGVDEANHMMMSPWSY